MPNRYSAILSGCMFLISACDLQGADIPFTYKGINYCSWQANEYLETQSSQSLDELKHTGANWAGLLVTWYQAAADSSIIAAESDSPTDAAVLAAIQDMHSRGLKVMLKPHVDCDNGAWRGYIVPTDPAAWFSSYTDFIVHFASLAQSANVEMLCLGTELANISDSSYLTYWESVIQQVRDVYFGKLTYAANAYAVPDEYETVCFWSLLDIAGVDVYTPLTNHSDPTVAQLVAGWTNNPSGGNRVKSLRDWAATLGGKPVIFTEIGYQSAKGANTSPNYINSTPDEQEQANCYEAAFEVWVNESSWLKGIFWWNWTVYTPQSTDFSPQGKLAESVLDDWYDNSPVINQVVPVTALSAHTVVFQAAATDPDGDSLSYTWDFGDGYGSTAASPSHTYPSAGQYNGSVSVQDGRGGTCAFPWLITVIANSSPQVVSPITFSPPRPTAGEQIQFTIAATDPDSDTVAYSWSFDDYTGTTAGAAVSHVFVNAGSYTVCATMTDGYGGTTTSSVTVPVSGPIVGSGVDSTGTGYSDSFLAATGFVPTQPLTVDEVQRLAVSKTSIKLNFAKPTGNDAVSMMGTLQIPGGFSINGQKVYVDIGGVMAGFTLGPKGISPQGNSQFAVKVKSAKGVVKTQTAPYTVTLKKGSFAAALAAEGLIKAATSKPVSTSVTLRAVTVIFNNAVLQKDLTLSYKATNKSGVAH